MDCGCSLGLRRRTTAVCAYGANDRKQKIEVVYTVCCKGARVFFCCYAVREDLKKIQCLSSLISLQNIVLIVHLLQVVLSTDRKMISFTVSPPFLLYFFFFISLSLLKAGLPTFFDILSCRYGRLGSAR